MDPIKTETMNLKIDLKKQTFHFRQPAGTSRGVYTERGSWLVTATDGDRTGMGECAPLPQLSCDDRPDYPQVLRQYCDQIERTGQLDAELLRDCPSMLFGLETAMLHLQRGDRLFDTPFSRGEEGIPINGLVWMGRFDEMAERLEQKLEQGFRCVKLKIGAIRFDDELELVRRIRNRYSHREVELRVDANGAFAYEDALYRMELLSQYAIHSIEQPIRAGQWSYMAELCRNSPLPIALDEELIGVNDPDQKRQMLNIIRPAYIVLKPSLHGGMMGVREWVDTAKSMGIGSWITSALEGNIGLDAIAQLAAAVYGPAIRMPQGLGTGQLFTDNIPMPLIVKGDKLWRCR